jgi:hypothetical protein
MSRSFRFSWLVLILVVLVVPPASADNYNVYTQAGIPPGSNLWTWCFEGQPCDIQTFIACETPEGGASQRANTQQWAGWGVFPPTPADLTAYENGELRFFIKGPADFDGAAIPEARVFFEIACQSVPGAALNPLFLADLPDWNPENYDSWQEITIPICDFFEGGVCDTTCLGAISGAFLSTMDNLPRFASFSVDYVRWHVDTSDPEQQASSVQIQDRQLLVDGKPFAVNGIAYQPVPECQGWQYAWYDRADRYMIDFPLMAASGANVVRLYAPIVTKAMLDAAWAEGLYVIPTFGVDDVQLSCPVGRDFMQDRFVEMVEEWGNHPALLLWLIGNEVNGRLDETTRCSTWYPHLDSMAAAAHTAEGASFHPVGTANSIVSADLADICQAGCSDDTTLPNVDFWAAQAYVGCTFQSIFDTYAAKADCARPLIITEFGVDAWDSRASGGGAEDQVMQADCLESLLVDAGEALAVTTPGGVSSGQVIFEWADEWWKSECVPTTDWCLHDTCVTYENWLYDPEADYGMNEEWWGIATLDDTDPEARGLRLAYEVVGDAWMGSLCNVLVDDYDSGTGNATLSFDAAAGNATSSTLYYGPLSGVSSYAYSGSVTGLDVTGPVSATLPSGSLFWVMVAENGILQEGCYGTDSAGTARPCSPDPGDPGVCDRDQTAGYNCFCPAP